MLTRSRRLSPIPFKRLLIDVFTHRAEIGIALLLRQIGSGLQDVYDLAYHLRGSSVPIVLPALRSKGIQGG